MKNTRIHFETHGKIPRGFQAAVSLHSHTLHSRETLAFVTRLGRRCAPLAAALARGQAVYRAKYGTSIDWSRAWWTPPVGAHDAWLLERRHIQKQFCLQSLVSLTDHDNIEAGLCLRSIEGCKGAPISVEWTVPYGRTFFHLGVHNLPWESATEIMALLSAFTADPRPAVLGDLLADLHRRPTTLIVFNHPCWDEKGIGRDIHLGHATEFICKYGASIDALELNGLRPWEENRRTLHMAESLSKPLISGGDRHALEPNALLDLTNADSFDEFAAQVRAGCSDVLITEQYREPFALRVLQNLEDILHDQPGHALGWVRWSDRVFYHCDDNVVRSLTDLFSRHVPGAVQIFVNAIKMMRRHSFRRSVRFAFPRRQELAL